MENFQPVLTYFMNAEMPDWRCTSVGVGQSSYCRLCICRLKWTSGYRNSTQTTLILNFLDRIQNIEIWVRKQKIMFNCYYLGMKYIKPKKKKRYSVQTEIPSGSCSTVPSFSFIIPSHFTGSSVSLAKDKENQSCIRGLVKWSYTSRSFSNYEIPFFLRKKPTLNPKFPISDLPFVQQTS